MTRRPGRAAWRDSREDEPTSSFDVIADDASGPPTAKVPAFDHSPLFDEEGGGSSPPTEATRQVAQEQDRPPASSTGSRFAVVYETAGPRVRLGIGWALLVAGALAVPSPYRAVGLVVLYGATAGLAASEILVARCVHPRPFQRWVVIIGAATLPLATSFGVWGTVTACLVLAAACLLAASVGGDVTHGIGSAASQLLAAATPGLAGAAVVLAEHYSVTGVIILLVLAAVYEASDYIVGSGASLSFEGPLAGAISIAAATAVVAALGLAPFYGSDAYVFGALAIVGCPAGQLLAFALLPAAGARAPALRRLDSLLLLAPCWALLIGLYVVRDR